MKKTRILITGAGTGIGHDLALVLAQKSYCVLASTHREAEAKALLAEAKKSRLVLESFALDITRKSDLEKAAAWKPDILVNNAAVGESGPLAEIPMERVEHLMEVNVLSTLRMTQACLPHMLKNKNGRVITIASVAGRLVLPYLGAYNMSKFAIEAACDALRMELKGKNIAISIVEPGLIYTGFNEKMAATKYEWMTHDSFFKNDLASMKAYDDQLTPNSYPTDSVVKALLHAIESPRPKIRYTVPFKYACIVFLMRFMPDFMKDRIMRKVMLLQ